MPRLSCIIPVVGCTDGLETTLVSVLEKRPDNCEILVVLNTPYDDPYDLKSEIRFVQAAPAVGLCGCFNLGVQVSTAPIVHLLSAGLEVSEGWADAALAHFADPTVAAVAPVIRNAVDPSQLASAGGVYHRGGRAAVRRRVGRNASAASILGPTAHAAFYRKSALELLGDGLPVSVGDELAGVDLALGLKLAGFRAVLEPESAVFTTNGLVSGSRGFRYGLESERLFWRNALTAGWPWSLVMHPWTVAGELLRALPNWAGVPQLLGRMAAWFRVSDYRMHHNWLRVVGEIATRKANEPTASPPLPPNTRVDSAHPAIRTGETREARARL